MNASRIKKFLFLFFVLLIALPFVQNLLRLIEERPLYGFFHLSEEPTFSIKEWNLGAFQEKYSTFINDHVGFRNFFVRLNNQLDFSVFNKPNGDEVIIGKNENLFLQTYVDGYTGEDFIGGDGAERRMRMFRFLQEEFKKKNIDLILIFAPGKASFYPEDIPKRFLVTKREDTNYKYYLKKCNDLNIQFLDFNQYFLSLKKTTKHPLYPKYGVHLTDYGSAIVADSIVRFIEKIKGINLPDVLWKDTLITDAIHGSDYDASDLINLFEQKKNPPMAYPILCYAKNAKKKLNVLAVSDSYYMGVMKSNIPLNVFENSTYWEYNKNIYSSNWQKTSVVAEVNLKEEIEKQNVIIVMSTEATLAKLSYGFIEAAFELYAPKEKKEKLEMYEFLIRNDAEWFKKINETALEKNITLDSALKGAAQKAYISELADNNKVKEDRIRFYEEKIKKIPSSMILIKKKAEENKVSLEEMIRLDAIWLYNEENKK